MSDKGESSVSFSYHEETQQNKLLTQMLILQKLYERMKLKYERLKHKYQYQSEEEGQKPTQSVFQKTQSIPVKLESNIQISKPLQDPNQNQQSIRLNLSEQFSWHQSEKSQVLQKNLELQLYKKPKHQTINRQLNLSQTSQNFEFEENIKNYQKYPHQTQKLYQNKNQQIQEKELFESSKSKNSDNFEFSRSHHLDFPVKKQNIQTQLYKKVNVEQQSSVQNDSDNFELSQEKDKLKFFTLSNRMVKKNVQDIFVYKSAKGQNQSSSFSYEKSSNSKQQNSDNINFSLDQSNKFKHQDEANSDDFQLDESQILPKKHQIPVKKSSCFNPSNLQRSQAIQSRQKSKIQVHSPKLSPQKIVNSVSESNEHGRNISILKKVQIEDSSMKSYDDSKIANIDVFKYQLKEFSFRLPDQINEPIEINQQDIKNHHLQPIKRINDIPNSKSINLNKKLDKIGEIFDEPFDSDEEETQFYRKLINKLNTKRKIPINELKKISIEMRKLSQKYNFLQQIFQTGTYQLDLSRIYFDEKVFLQEFSTWNRTLITEVYFDNQWIYEEIDNIFKTFEFPNLKSVTFKMNDRVLDVNGRIEKFSDQNFDINFLRYFGLCKKLKSLALKGETMTEQLATSIVDLDFPSLKSLYIGFQAPLIDQVVDILLCNQLRNFPKCKIYIATWEGAVDERFRLYFEKIDFQTLQTDDSQDD